MFYYSTLGNSGTCPYWEIPVTVIGKYRKRSDGAWSFYQAQCPIIENSILPYDEQEPSIRGMRCPNRYKCPLYTEFQSSVTEII